MEPSTPPPRPSVPATSPYGSPDPLSDPPGPLSPESPLPTLPAHLPPSSQFTTDNTPCKPRARVIRGEEENGPIVQQSSCPAALPDSSMESKFAIFLPSESSPPPEFQTSPMKQPTLQTVQEQEDFKVSVEMVDVEEMDTQNPSFNNEYTEIPVSETVHEKDGLDASISIGGIEESEIQEPTPDNEYIDLPALPTIAESPPAESFQPESFTLTSSPPRMPSPTPSTTTTPSVPAAKRRRLNSSMTATNKLMRPFKSPLKSNTTLHNTSTPSRESPRKYPPSTPPQKTAIPYTPLPRLQKPGEGIETAVEDTKPIDTPVVRPQRSIKSTIKSNNPPFRSSFAKTSKLNLSSPALLSTKDPYILSLEQKLSQLQNSVRSAKQVLEESSQALKIEQSGEDDKLEELILKWRQAAQNAADHMFSGAEQRFQRMGGMAGYRERQNRSRSGGGWGFADEDPEEGLTEDQKEARRLAMYEAGFDEMSELEKQQNETKNPVKDDGDVSTSSSLPIISFCSYIRERYPYWILSYFNIQH
ncbi:ERAD-associated protein [Orbilia oligospora]|nr:ERAD-associated protein [Orbilia oligospora]KAF3260225.1 ERAD-associated protein [Orbilia oligospora]KAF3272515.1 ERAD-associated protein [Orbilia oligospora]KAF3292041.1 ERAD-associated protein [Orbilia oligospora]